LVRPLLGHRSWWRWLAFDVLVPEGLVLVVVATAQTLAPGVTQRGSLFLLLAATWFAAALMAGSAMPWLREQALWHLQQLRTRSFRPAS
jgi:hypothetical protein